MNKLKHAYENIKMKTYLFLQIVMRSDFDLAILSTIIFFFYLLKLMIQKLVL